MPRSAIQYDAPDPTETSQSHQASKGWFRSQCEYANLCAIISDTAHHTEKIGQRLTVEWITTELQKWLDSTPSTSARGPNDPLSDSMRMYLFFQYSEAILAISQIVKSSTAWASVSPSVDHSIRLDSLAKAIFISGRKTRYAEFDG